MAGSYDTCSLIMRLQPSLNAAHEDFRISCIFFWLCQTWFGCVEPDLRLAGALGAKGPWFGAEGQRSVLGKSSWDSCTGAQHKSPFNNPEAHTKLCLFKPLKLPLIFRGARVPSNLEHSCKKFTSTICETNRKCLTVFSKCHMFGF